MRNLWLKETGSRRSVAQWGIGDMKGAQRKRGDLTLPHGKGKMRDGLSESQRRKAGIAFHQKDSVFWHDPMKEMLSDPWGS